MSAQQPRSAEQIRAEWTGIADRAEALVQDDPQDPTRYQPLMAAVHELLLDIANLMAELNDARYEAERKWTRKWNVTMGRYIEQGATFARAAADVAALDEREVADDLKVIFHHAEDTQKALQAKHFALLNINRGLQQAMGGFRG